MNLSESVAAILSCRCALTSRFYEQFFERVPEAEGFFDDTNMKHQAVILRMSLQIVEQFCTHGYEAIGEYLQVIGCRHRTRGIPENLYAEWRDTLLDTLEEFHGEDWTETLEAEWSGALNQSIDQILEGYRLSSAAI